jgi:hypothetical protein
MVKGLAATFMLVALVSAQIVAAAGDGAGREHDAPKSAIYRDSTGEDRAAPDITRVLVRSGPNGPIVFRISIANRPQATADVGVEIVIDADRAEATGDRTLKLGLGADYLVTILEGEPRLRRWTGRGWRAATPPAYTDAGGTVSISLWARQLGRPAGLRFGVSVAVGIVPESDGTLDITDARFDFAPDAGRPAWSYSLV